MSRSTLRPNLLPIQWYRRGFSGSEVESLLFRFRFNVFPLESSSLSLECGSETDYYVYVFPNVQLINHV